MPSWTAVQAFLTVLNTLGLIAVILAFVHLWRAFMDWRANAPIDGSARAEVHRLTGKVNLVERELADVHALMTKMDTAAVARDKERSDTLRDLLRSSTAQLDSMERTRKLILRLDLRQRELNRQVEDLPCIGNGTSPSPTLEHGKEGMPVDAPSSFPPTLDEAKDSGLDEE